jgi:hypothetical protein
MITQMSNGWYIADEAEVPRIVDALTAAGYQRLPHWFLVHGRTSIIIQCSRRGHRVFAPPELWEAYPGLLDLGDPAEIARLLDIIGWHRRPSYGFSGPGAAVSIMSGAISDGEYSLEIRGPKPHLVRAVLAPLGVEQGAGM